MARSSSAWPCSRCGFSLAELMIALIILGLGLLFIAAALPVGLEYTRQTVDLATGAAATADALNQLALNLRTSDALYDRDVSIAVPVGSGLGIRLDNVHRPRNSGLPQPPNPRWRYRLADSYEPLFKVRPLAMGNIRVGVVPPGATRELVDDVEVPIATYLAALGINPPTPTWEIDVPLGVEINLIENPTLPGLARVYPPVEPVTTFTVEKFFPPSHDDYPTYNARFRTLDWQQLDRERGKALGCRVAWTAFYRRVSYKGDAGADGHWYTNDDTAEAPLLYELIVVVTRRTSLNHRFPRQDLSVAGLPAFEDPQAWGPLSPLFPPSDDVMVGTDRLAPMPWLVTFDSNQALPVPDPADYVVLGAGPDYERVLVNNFVDPATLTFRCTAQVGALLPVGSIFIPAVNDQRYIPTGTAQQVGFVPSAPEALPIYEVVERPDPTTVIVKNNGYYPWLNPVGSLTASAWPVWVIPPAFVQRGNGGQPIYERTSPILKVERRTVTLREVTP